MPDIHLSVKGGEEFTRLARKLYTGVHTDLEREVKQDIRKAARPLSRSVKRQTPDYLPDKYALGDLAASLEVRTQIHPEGVTVTAGATGMVKARALPAIEAGVLRHPVYGRYLSPWVNQTVRSGFFTEPIEAGLPYVQAKALEAIQAVADKIAGG